MASKTMVTEAGALIPKQHQKMLLRILDRGGYPVEILQTQDNAVKTIRFQPAKRRKPMRLWAR